MYGEYCMLKTLETSRKTHDQCVEKPEKSAAAILETNK